MNSAIKIEALEKQYRGTDNKALNGLNLEIKAGEIYGLLGPNGAGKTTTLSILCGLLKANAGKITYFDDADFDLKKHIGVVPQDIALFESLSGKENLRYFAAMYGLDSKVIKPEIQRLLARFGLAEKADHLLKNYSGGMKRRINLLAAVLHRPKILFLDEPTVGIDVQSKKVILEFLQELNRAGTTIIYTSHYMEEAEKICHRVGIIETGEIIIEGKPSELLEQHTDCTDLEGIFIKLTGKKLRD
ncbi:MAG: ABC transporter ATP-binding protein [Chitinophagales bacterium]